MNPRSYQPCAQVLQNVYATMLDAHPQAFDCIIYPAKSSEQDEIIADNRAVATLLDRDERSQEFEPPVNARAMIVPKAEMAFDVTESGSYESFHAPGEAITLMLSLSGLRRYSLIEWQEYLAPDSDETISRIIYIADEKPIGRTLNAQMLYVCYPLPAMGEKPDREPNQPDPCPENPPDIGIL